MAEHRSFASEPGAGWTTVFAIALPAVSAVRPRNTLPHRPRRWRPGFHQSRSSMGRSPIRVVYPPAGAAIQARDSNFIFGTVGSGKGDTQHQRHIGAGSAQRKLHRVLAPPARECSAIRDRRGAGSGHRAGGPYGQAPCRRDPCSLTPGDWSWTRGVYAPRGTRVARADERIRVSVRAPRNASVGVRLADESELRLVSPAGTGFAPADRRGSTRTSGRPMCRRPRWRLGPSSSSAVGSIRVRFPIRDITVDDPTAPTLGPPDRRGRACPIRIA